MGKAAAERPQRSHRATAKDPQWIQRVHHGRPPETCTGLSKNLQGTLRGLRVDSRRRHKACKGSKGPGLINTYQVEMCCTASQFVIKSGAIEHPSRRPKDGNPVGRPIPCRPMGPAVALEPRRPKQGAASIPGFWSSGGCIRSRLDPGFEAERDPGSLRWQPT